MRVVDRGTKREVRGWKRAMLHASAFLSAENRGESTNRQFARLQVSSKYTSSLSARCGAVLANRLDAFRGSTSRERIIRRRGSYRGNIGKFVALSGFYLFPVQRFSSALATELGDDFWLTASTNEKRRKRKNKMLQTSIRVTGKNEDRERENGTNDRVSSDGFVELPEIKHIVREILMDRWTVLLLSIHILVQSYFY